MIPALFFFTSVLQATDAEVMRFLIPSLKAGVWPASDPTYLVVAYNIGAALGPLLLIVRWPGLPARLTMTMALGVLAMSELAMGALPSFGGAIIVRALAGAASGVLSFSQLAMAVQVGGRSIAGMTAGFLVALVAGAPLAALLASRFGPGPLYLMVGAMLAGITALALWLLPPAVSQSRTAAGFERLLSHPRLRLGILTSVLVGAGIAGPMTLLPSELQRPGGAALTLAETGRLYLVTGLGPLFALMLSGAASRLGSLRARAQRLAWPLVPAVLLLPLAATSAGFAGALITLALLFETLRRTALQGLIGQLPEQDDRTRYLGLRGIIVQVGLAIGTTLADQLRDRLGFGFACAAGALLIGASALMIPRES